MFASTTINDYINTGFKGHSVQAVATEVWCRNASTTVELIARAECTMSSESEPVKRMRQTNGEERGGSEKEAEVRVSGHRVCW